LTSSLYRAANVSEVITNLAYISFSYTFPGVWLLGRCVAVVGMSPWHYWQETITNSLTITLFAKQPLSNDTFHI